MVRPSPARDRVLRTLLSASARNAPRTGPPQFHSLYSLASYCEVSYPWVHELASTLTSLGFLEQGTLRVKNAKALFSWWKENSPKPTIHSFHAPDPKLALLKAASLAKAPVAITTYYAENAFQGHLFPRRMDAYARPQDFALLRTTLLTQGAQLGGTNLRIWIRDDHLPIERIHIGPANLGLQYAPVAQVILDLYLEGGSASEAADMLVETAYGPT